MPIHLRPQNLQETRRVAHRSTRREMLSQSAAGFGLLGLASALPAATVPIVHFPPKAKRVIFLFMNGAPSHVDTFDPKPALAKHEGEKPSGDLFKAAKAGYMPSPFRFRQYGSNGTVMSELLPQLAKCADEICVLRGMHTDVPNHEPGLLLMNSGHQQPVRPSLGSWASYGLGTENQNLPSFVVLCPGRPVVGPQLWSNGFLPGQHQGTSVDTNHLEVDKLIANLRHPNMLPKQQRRQLDLISAINRLHQRERENDQRLEAQIRSMEMAFRMQTEAAEAFDVTQETVQVRAQYGKSPFGRSCLLARRLIERGVRFVELIDTGSSGNWDAHGDMMTHVALAKNVDQPIAALIMDLKQRGLLDETLVVWTTEFGRTPFNNTAEAKGREHHPWAFTSWLAGAGLKPGIVHGATDEYGLNSVVDPVHVHDLHCLLYTSDAADE